MIVWVTIPCILAQRPLYSSFKIINKTGNKQKQQHQSTSNNKLPGHSHLRIQSDSDQAQAFSLWWARPEICHEAVSSTRRHPTDCLAKQ